MTTVVKAAPVRNSFAPAQSAWRTILTHVQPEAEAQPRLAVAADLARKLDATLLGVGAEMLQPIAVSDSYGLIGGGFLSAMLDLIQTHLTHAEETFRRATDGQPSQWVSVQDLPRLAVTRLSRGADLIVAGGSPLNARDSYRWCDPGELVLQSGRPVLVAPPTGGKLKAEAVVVAWKDTRESRRALADSLPILKCADDVVLLETCAAQDAKEVEPHHKALVRHLANHGVKARSKIDVAPADETCGRLQAEARAIGADLIVAGAYGHSRLGEWVFGGVTADLLANPQRFVLFSH